MSKSLSKSSNDKVLLDQVIQSLEIATQLDKSGRHRIEAATKYYESCYLMRQIVASSGVSTTSRQQGDGSSSVCSTISTTCRRLLEDKIEYYTKVAQRLYFDDSAASVAQAGGGNQPAAPTSVIINLLDDVVSVLTSTNHPLEQQQQPHPYTATPPQQQHFHPSNVPTTASTAVATTRSNPSTLLQLPVVATIVRRGSNGGIRRHPNNNNDNNNNNNANSKNIRTTGTKSTTRTRLSKFAKVEAERKIHIKMNLANSKLGQSIDLDEYYYQNQHQNNNTDTTNIIIDSYVDASEFYLDAIKLAEDHQKKYSNIIDNNKSHYLKLSLSSKVDPWRGTPGASQPSKSSPSSSPIGTVIPKLKHLLILALDRVETLKKKMNNMNTNINTEMMTKKTIITTPRYNRSPQNSSCLYSLSASASASSSSLPSLSLSATIIVIQN